MGKYHNLGLHPKSHQAFPHRSGTLTNGILVLICVNAGVRHSTKQVVQNGCQGLGIEHPMQSTHKHRPAGVESLKWAPDKVAVSQDPGDHLYLKTTQRNVRLAGARDRGYVEAQASGNAAARLLRPG